MSFPLQIDSTSSTPVFEQVVEQVVAGIRAGRLVPGQKLPPVRQLATELGIATNTVAKAYRQLEQEGQVETRGRRGTIVREELDGALPVSVAAQEFVRTARAGGLDVDQAIGLLRRSW